MKNDLIPVKIDRKHCKRMMKTAALIIAAVLLLMTAVSCDDVSGGDLSVVMPDLVGKYQDRAVKELNDIGITAVTTETESDALPAGTVLRQDPAAGESIKVGGKATLYVAVSKQDPTTPTPTKPAPTIPAPTSPAPTKPAPTSPAPTKYEPTYLYCIADDYVSLRSGPNENEKELIKIRYGEKMVYLNTPYENWIHVTYSGENGFVYKDYVSTTNPIVPDGSLLYCVASDYVSLREGPGETTKEICKIPRGDMMGYVNYHQGHWLRVDYGTDTGFVYDKYVSLNKPN